MAGAFIDGEAEFTLFLAGKRVGAEQVRVARAGSHSIISSTGQFGPPLNVTVNRFELRYTATGSRPTSTSKRPRPGRAFALTTSFGVTTATNVITQNGVTSSKTDQISARTIVLVNNFYAGYVVLARATARRRARHGLPAYIAPSAEVKINVEMQSSTSSCATARARSRRRCTS